MFRATFYSFRGGVGRTMAMTNVAYQLALARQDVVLIDFDLEAPGLTLMPEFQPVEGGAPAQSGGLAAFLAAGLKNEPVPKVKDLCYVPQIQTMPNLKGKIHVLPAGEVAGALRLDDLYADMPRSFVLDDLLLQIEQDINPAYLLIDSRTGLTEIGGICTTHLGEYVVVLFGLNEQNLQGTALMLERLRRVRKDLAEKCILVASPVPQGEERLKSERLDRARELLAAALGESADKLLDALTLPYHPELALTEKSIVARFPDGELATAYNRITIALRDANPRDSGYLFDKAVNMLRVNPTRALDILDRLRTSEDLPQAHGLRALLLKHSGKLEEADAAFRKALELDPRSPGMLGDYATFLAQQERFDEAEDYYHRAVEADPKHANNLGNYATFLGQRGRFAEAEDYYHRAFEVDPKEANHLGNYATIMAQQDRIDEAEDYYRRAVEADPKHADNLGKYGLFLSKRERFEEAESYYRRALEVDPKNAKVLCNYGWLLFGFRGDLEGALRETDAGLAVEPKRTLLLLNRGIFLLLLGRADEARASYDAALRAGGQANAKELQAGLKDLREAVSKYPEAKGVREMADWLEGRIDEHLDGDPTTGHEGTPSSESKD